VKVSGVNGEVNQQLENAGRTADFLEFAELMARDALHRNESCGGHFRTDHQYPDGEAKRDDANYTYSAAWEYKGVGKEPELHKEPLKFENVHLAVRSYK
jgi:succinate dehydrogenase / fumarate reductase flavoprotein subunit